MIPEMSTDWIFWFMVTFMFLLIGVVAAARGEGNLFQSTNKVENHYHYGGNGNDK